MSLIINKPHIIFWASIPIMILYGIFNKNEMLDINVHDTYFVFSKTDLTKLISILFAIIGLGYWIMIKTNRRLSKWLNFIHITLTFGSILLIWILAHFFRESIMEYDYNEKLTLGIYLAALISVFVQIIFPINIIFAIIKKVNKTSE